MPSWLTCWRPGHINGIFVPSTKTNETYLLLCYISDPREHHLTITKNTRVLFRTKLTGTSNTIRWEGTSGRKLMASFWSAVLINSPGESFNSSPSRETSTKRPGIKRTPKCNVSGKLYIILNIRRLQCMYIYMYISIELVLVFVFLPLPLLFLGLLLVVVEHLLKSAKFANAGRLK